MINYIVLPSLKFASKSPLKHYNIKPALNVTLKLRSIVIHIPFKQ